MRAVSASAMDAARVRCASWRVALTVAVGSVVIIGVITVVIVALVLARSRADPTPGRRGGDRYEDRVVGVVDVVPLIVLLGAIGIVVLAALSWFTARRATEPLAAALRLQRAFVADASHELRTPLTALTSRVELAMYRARRGGDVISALVDVRQDAAVMDAVLTDLLLAAATAASDAAADGVACDVFAAAAGAGDTLHARALAADVGIRLNITEGMRAAIDGTALMRVLVALLDNAVRAAPAGSIVRIDADRAGDRVQLRVSDAGAGITEIPSSRVFERFATSTDATDSTRGFGLGLPLARDTLARFHGTVGVERTGVDGTAFLVTIPAAR